MANEPVQNIVRQIQENTYDLARRGGVEGENLLDAVLYCITPKRGRVSNTARDAVINLAKNNIMLLQEVLQQVDALAEIATEPDKHGHDISVDKHPWWPERRQLILDWVDRDLHGRTGNPVGIQVVPDATERLLGEPVIQEPSPEECFQVLRSFAMENNLGNALSLLERLERMFQE